MLEQLEAAHRGEGDVCGFSADIVKAFNILPRVPALAAVKLLGVDQGTLVGWAGALSGFVRHFVVRGNFSPGVTSVNGFPEGCALSCLAMLALTQLFHRWLQATNVMFTPISYVDNWGVILRNVQSMRQACDAVDAFAEALQLDLDKKKSYCWASDRDSRRFLRGEGFAVRLHTKELGAHVVSSCQLSNFHALERFRQLADFWQKLTNSPCVYQQKVTLIMRVAWPRAFHGVSAVVIGRKHFDNPRTCIMQGLKLQKPGANPELQCIAWKVICLTLCFTLLLRLSVMPEVCVTLNMLQLTSTLPCSVMGSLRSIRFQKSLVSVCTKLVLRFNRMPK